METPPSTGAVKKKETRGRKPKPKEDKREEPSQVKSPRESKKEKQQQQLHQQQQQQASVDEKYSQWKSLVPVLYDWLANHNLVWPSLSCRLGFLFFLLNFRFYLMELCCDFEIMLGFCLENFGFDFD